ncbi:MAG: hypothetical protein ACOZNI_25765 [Myxococcota bacterium]
MIALLACVGADAPPTEGPAPRVFPSVAEALAVVLADAPRVIGVGELHATTDGPAVPTTLSRFTRDVLPLLAPRATDLVIETWRLDGRCGAQEEQVVAQVEADTKRPEATKSELVLLVEAAVALNVRPHDLALTCDEYAAVQGPDGNIVYDALLKLLGGKLGEYAARASETPGATVVIYGGAVHNDVTPREGLEPWSYGVAAAARGSYVELDLYQPELVGEAMREPAIEAGLAAVGPKQVVLVERGMGSWVLLLEAAR